jgi:hypothetical protein
MDPTQATPTQVKQLYGTAAFAGITAALCSAPFISIVDKAITSNASGREPLWTCVGKGLQTLFKQPGYFIRQPSYVWIAGVYGGTYLVANWTQLWCERKNVPWQYPKFAATSTTNVGLSMLKDRAFARMFAAQGTPTRPFPTPALGLFALRDAMTVFASFNLPPLLTPVLVDQTGLSTFVVRSALQLLTPLVMQVFSVPFHLLGLDLYNRPNPEQESRVAFIKREYGKTVVARWCRILPAFGIGGVINVELLELSRKLLGLPHFVHETEESVSEILEDVE